MKWTFVPVCIYLFYHYCIFQNACLFSMNGSRATDEPSAQPGASAISGGGDGLWERYFCEVCNFNSDKFVDVERHKQNVHAKQQQTDFATYVTRTLLRSLVICSQFHQCFTSAFFLQIFCQSKIVTRKSCQNDVCTKNVYVKTLMKLTHGLLIKSIYCNFQMLLQYNYRWEIGNLWLLQ